MAKEILKMGCSMDVQGIIKSNPRRCKCLAGTEGFHPQISQIAQIQE
jgi:hypothetical protein